MQIKTGLILVGLLAGGVVVYRAKQTATKAITETFNPASDKNIVYQGTQDTGNFIGRKLACVFNDCSTLPAHLR